MNKRLSVFFAERGLNLEPDGFTMLNPLWEDLRVNAYSTKLGGSKDPGFAKILDNGSGSQGVFSYLFDAVAEEEVYFAVQLPHAWKQGTSLHPHVHWVPTVDGAAGQKVSWGLEYSFSEIGRTFPATSIIYGDTSFPEETLVAKRHYLTELTPIVLPGVASVSPMILCRLFRDATGTGGVDSYTSDAGLMEFDFHLQIDSFGSKSEYSKA